MNEEQAAQCLKAARILLGASQGSRTWVTRCEQNWRRRRMTMEGGLSDAKLTGSRNGRSIRVCASSRLNSQSSRATPNVQSYSRIPHQSRDPLPEPARSAGTRNGLPGARLLTLRPRNNQPAPGRGNGPLVRYRGPFHLRNLSKATTTMEMNSTSGGADDLREKGERRRTPILRSH